MAEEYRTSPDHENTGWPPGVAYIIGNEGCERFSFYGMKAILYLQISTLFMHSLAEGLAKDTATAWVHTFNAAVYAFPIIGAVIADRLLGKYRTILWLSLVYCAGHAVMSAGDFLLTEEDTQGKLQLIMIGLALIAIGSGGIKPCVSANVGDQFGKANWFRVRTVFQSFYFIINFGSAFATILIPFTLEHFGAGVAFGIPGILMFIATFMFWTGRAKFVHVPPTAPGLLGVLDVLSASLLFTPIAIFLFSNAVELTGLALSGDLEQVSMLFVYIGVGVGAFILGAGVFGIRNKMQPDDGFVAIMLHVFFGRGKPTAPVGSAGHLGGGVAVPSATPDDDPSAKGYADHPLLRSSFWGDAARRYGPEAVEGPIAVLKIITVFAAVSVFWALFDQHSSTWIRQGEMMNLQVTDTWKLLPSQLPAMNPFMVMALIPIMNRLYSLYEKVTGKVWSPLGRITVGMFMAALSFVSVALLQMRIESQPANTVSALWQAIPYTIITISEVMVSITGLEFAYTQAPKRMKSTVMGFWLLTVAFGNKLVVVISKMKIENLSDSFWVFTGLMTIAAVVFGIRAKFYTPKEYTQ